MTMAKVKTDKMVLSGEVETGTAYKVNGGRGIVRSITYWHDIDVYQ